MDHRRGKRENGRSDEGEGVSVIDVRGNERRKGKNREVDSSEEPRDTLFPPRSFLSNEDSSRFRIVGRPFVPKTGGGKEIYGYRWPKRGKASFASLLSIRMNT